MLHGLYEMSHDFYAVSNNFIMQDCVRVGVAVTALSVPEEDLPEVNGELGNRRVNDEWPLS